MSQLKIEWCGIDITYNEDRDFWQFQIEEGASVRNRKSLAEAKKAVQELTKKKKEFQPFELIWVGQGEFPFGAKIKVTSITSDRMCRATHNGENKHVHAGDNIAEVTEENAALAVEYNNLVAQIRELESQKYAIKRKFTIATLPYEK